MEIDNTTNTQIKNYFLTMTLVLPRQLKKKNQIKYELFP